MEIPICFGCQTPKRKVGLGFRCDACAPDSLPPDMSPTAVRRFWAKIDMSPGQGPQGDCWEWRAGRDRDGYGQFGGHSWALRAHRYSWLVHNSGGTLHTDDHIAHRCDNPPCVNPDHLFKTDQMGNRQDSIQKGQRYGARFGEENHNAKITESDVRDIRTRYAAGGISQSALGILYGLTQSHIKDIVKFRRWKHVGIEPLPSD